VFNDKTVIRKNEEPMSNKNRNAGKQVTVKTGNISNNSGQVNVAAGNITVHQAGTNLDGQEIRKLFNELYAAIETRPNTPLKDKEGLKAEVEEIQDSVIEAIEQKQEVNEGFFLRRFRNIARMAPDMLDVVVATIGNPLAGLGVAAKKIAEKAKEEAK
jgi:hypothetical protein